MRNVDERFYKTKQWKECRETYLKKQHYLCERCGRPANTVHHRIHLTAETMNNPELTLNFSNLEALCAECHNKEHHKSTLRYSYDAKGEIVYG